MKTSLITRTIVALVALFIILTTSCNKSGSSSKTTPTCDGTASTYNSNVKAIIDGACTSSNCHPNYSTYAGIKSILGDGQFNSHVLSSQDMPRGSSLSSDQLNKLKCWSDAGFPEK